MKPWISHLLNPKPVPRTCETPKPLARIQRLTCGTVLSLSYSRSHGANGDMVRNTMRNGAFRTGPRRPCRIFLTIPFDLGSL